MEREFSVEFCSRHGHHGDCLMDATIYKVEKWMEQVYWWIADGVHRSTTGDNAVNFVLFWANE
jgi:hypothetical protein